MPSFPPFQYIRTLENREISDYRSYGFTAPGFHSCEENLTASTRQNQTSFLLETYNLPYMSHSIAFSFFDIAVKNKAEGISLHLNVYSAHENLNWGGNSFNFFSGLSITNDWFLFQAYENIVFVKYITKKKLCKKNATATSWHNVAVE